MTGPRLSIIPARFVEDTRPDLSHYKVLNALGRHLDSDGWCRVKQTTLADAIGLSRETVCRKLNNLVEWGYVEKDDEDGSGLRSVASYIARRAGSESTRHASLTSAISGAAAPPCASGCSRRANAR